ncbi:MAG: HAD family hydrolase [Planctomycetaceae bacterium]|nr:HAD family hydrolase [Planctomycetaceae bacterium]
MHSINKQNDYLIGIDSDGCVFDTMELKHKECFIPNIIRFYGLQGVSKYARQAAEFVNLYSKSRGINRFPALVETVEWLNRRPEIRQRGLRFALPESLVAWVKREDKLGNPALRQAVEATGDSGLTQALEWSVAVNDDIEKMVHGVGPFPLVNECLDMMNRQADLFVCSATPNAALESEWAEHGLRSFVQAICGQEAGSKKENLANARQYPANHCLMIGDAPGDYKAAAANHCLFFPIVPGQEAESWARLYNEGLDHFFQGRFAGEYQAQLLREFDAALPDLPPWPVVG